jgi:metal-sulfur cluster biosynthetic enzyme
MDLTLTYKHIFGKVALKQGKEEAGMEQAEVQERIDRVLARVADPSSGLPLDQLGLVQRVRWRPAAAELVVFLHRLGRNKACCVGFNLLLLATVEQQLAEELAREFPGLAIRFADATD